MLRAIIVDDEPLSVSRMKRILYDNGEVEIAEGFLNPLEALDYVEHHEVDIVFLDICMPELDGMQMSRQLTKLRPNIDVVFATGYDEYAVKAFELDALDYLVKPVTAPRLANTLDKIKKRRQSRSAAASFSDSVSGQQDGSFPGKGGLTDQEKRIVMMISEGLMNKQIAVHLNITAETVKWHIKNLYRKLEVNNRVQLLRLAKELNMI